MLFLFVFKKKTSYEVRISDWSSDVGSSDLCRRHPPLPRLRHGDPRRGAGRVRRLRSRHRHRVPRHRPGVAVPAQPSPFPQGPAGQTPDLLERLLPRAPRSEEHTSELQSLMRISYAVFCLKKKTILQYTYL